MVNILDIFFLEANGFYLCGSRALGTETLDSDWDMVAEYSIAKEGLLKEIGFSDETYKFDILAGPDKIVVASYLDVNTVKIFSLAQAGQNKIQAVLVKSVESKLRITKMLKSNADLRALDMSLKGTHARVYLWNSFYSLLFVDTNASDV